MGYRRRGFAGTIAAVAVTALCGCGGSSSHGGATPTPTATSKSAPSLTPTASDTATSPPTATATRTATTIPTATPTPVPTPAVFVYWDQNEEQDARRLDGRLVQLVAPWDPNGQMCLFPDSSGRPGQFVTGYNPTLPSQHNLGSLLPLKNPPVGMAVWDRHGGFTGQAIYVPGPYALPGSDIGGDIPPDNSSMFCTDGVTAHCSSDADCPNGIEVQRHVQRQRLVHGLRLRLQGRPVRRRHRRCAGTGGVPRSGADHRMVPARLHVVHASSSVRRRAATRREDTTSTAAAASATPA